MTRLKVLFQEGRKILSGHGVDLVDMPCRAARRPGAVLEIGLEAVVVGRMWLAVMTTPQCAFSQRTEKLSCGVERGASKMNATPPSRDSRGSEFRRNGAKKCLTSCAITSLGAS